MDAVRDFYHYHQVRNLSPISSKHNLNTGGEHLKQVNWQCSGSVSLPRSSLVGAIPELPLQVFWQM